ncbi:SERPINB14: Ovalbumin, partial [Crotalus adamanteus]
DYIGCLKEIYNSGLESTDFMNATEKVREKINSWVESRTNGAIKNFCPANSIDPSSLLVLVNAVNFKGMWRTQFNPKDTHRAVFWTGKGRSIYVEMMTREGNFNIANITNPSVKVLKLPYENEELSFFYFTWQITKKLTYKTLQEWTSSENMREIRIKLCLPKFSVEDTYSMKPILMGMGVNDMFMPGKANLSFISQKSNLFVSDFKFKGCIKISEDGVHAAAASRTEIVRGSNAEVNFNNPFIGILRHNFTGIILLIIRICVPE